MSQTPLHRAFAPVKRHAPGFVSRFLRRVGTALLTPVFFSLRSGHLRSSFAERAVTRSGAPLPWYTYPCIEFLAARAFAGRAVLEFGGGQSTLWWAARAARVVTLEGDPAWYEHVRANAPGNASVHLAAMDSARACVESVERILAGESPGGFDVVAIDGLYREDLVDVALRMVAGNGAIVCDNAETYGFHGAFRGKGMQRADFVGYAPGIVLPHCTSIYFRDGAALFSGEISIPTAADR